MRCCLAANASSPRPGRQCQRQGRSGNLGGVSNGAKEASKYRAAGVEERRRVGSSAPFWNATVGLHDAERPGDVGKRQVALDA